MDLTLLHPKIVHLPIALAVLMPVLTTAILFAWWRDWLPNRTWILALLFQAILVVSSIAALQTGEIDEERIEGTVAEAAIEAHEEAAEQFLWVTVVALFLLMPPVVLKRKGAALTAASIGVLSTLVVFGFGYRVGEAGGALVYGNANTSAPTQVTAPKLEHDDDD